MSDEQHDLQPNVPALSHDEEAEMGLTYRRRAYPYVTEGTVWAFALQEDMAPPAIPPGESEIRALAAMDEGIAYGLTAGARGHLCYFHPAFGVVHVGTLGEGAVGGGALVRAGAHEVLGGWWGDGGGGLFRHDTARELGLGSEQYSGSVTEIVSLPLPREGEGVAALAYNPTSGPVYGLTRPGGLLLALAAGAEATEIVGQVQDAAPVLVALPDGRLLGTAAEGRLWTYDPATEQLAALDAYAPCQAGKRYAAGVQSLVVTAAGQVYGGTSTDGYLFRWDPRSGEVVNLGKPNRQSNIVALAEAHNGLIFGMVGEQGALAHLFRYDPETRGFADLGVLSSTYLAFWILHQAGCMAVGAFGEIFLGETEPISHLFVYYPPHRRRRETPDVGGE